MHPTVNSPIEPKEKSDMTESFFDFVDLEVEASNFVLSLVNSFDFVFECNGCGATAAMVASTGVSTSLAT